jgi:hypothetical protein
MPTNDAGNPRCFLLGALRECARQELQVMLQISGQPRPARRRATPVRELTTHGISRRHGALALRGANGKYSLEAAAAELEKPPGHGNQPARFTVVVRGFARGT